MAVVELATVYQGDTLNGFCRDLAVYQWGLISKEERKMSCLPHAIKFLVTEAQTRLQLPPVHSGWWTGELALDRPFAHAGRLRCSTPFISLSSSTHTTRTTARGAEPTWHRRYRRQRSRDRRLLRACQHLWTHHGSSIPGWNMQWSCAICQAKNGPSRAYCGDCGSHWQQQTPWKPRQRSGNLSAKKKRERKDGTNPNGLRRPKDATRGDVTWHDKTCHGKR